ncbi:RUN and FYVE domain-containing protein 2-like isoform X2 [Lycorma delicatula]|uniref:RUN and FYVE domain-containing protein 2-like isoform X2 n=1 Tax=Lycorma delicatula TaxID=130591 RepID=UPI003F51A3B1
MAACSEDEPVSPLESRSYSSLNSPVGVESRSISRSPSVSSFDRWPSLLVSRRTNFSGRPVNKDPARDPVVIERRNLVNISKLIVKELIETSMSNGRMLDSDHMPLQHFFIVLEHVLRHGLKPKKGLLGPKKELWDLLQMVEKLKSEAQDITASIRDLPTVRTQMGRARAWLRLALMQKKLADYIKVLIDHRDDVLIDYFEQDALLMSEEAIIIQGLLTGLNVIDCNLCVKEEDLDCQQGVIDFSLYLRSSYHTTTSTNDDDDDNSPGEHDLDHDNMATVLDQKNYIEELNRHLNATVGNLQAKVEALTTTNALMKEDLEIAKSNILALIDENTKLKNEKPDHTNYDKISENDDGKAKDNELEKLQQRLEEERNMRQETERELHLQISLKAEMEVAMKLLEKDIHEKQDTIISLRRQLDDIKQINLEMYRKLQECESSLKHKTELITKLEAKTFAMTDTLQKLDEKQKVSEQMRAAIQQAASETEERSSGLEGELRVEREWRQNLQNTLVIDRDKISKLQEEVAQLQAVSLKYVSLQEEHFRLKEQCKEQELTLQELGAQLSKSKLLVSDLQEEASVSRSKSDVALWTSDKDATHCKACEKEFNLTRRKHHCRNCGEIFCNACSDNTAPLAISAKPVRVCDSCYELLIARFSVVQ